MKRSLPRFVCLSLFAACLFHAASHVHILKPQSTAAPLRPADEAARARVDENYGKLPLSFEANRGQADPSVKFLSRGASYSFAFAPAEATLHLREAVVRMKLAGANPNARIEGEEELPGKSNYLTGADPSKWRTNIPNYARVRYDEVWPGIDLVFYGNQQQLEYDFILAPGADPRAIKLSFEGAKKIQVDAGGDLILQLDDRELRQRKPVIYQLANGERRAVKGRYAIRNPRSAIRNPVVEFEIGRYDHSRELVIDPAIEYSVRAYAAESIAVDSQGNAYITSVVEAGDALFGRGGKEIRLWKLNSAGTQQLSNTVIGGSGDDIPHDLAIDSSGNVYITGETYSTDFPLNWGVPSNAGGGGCFKSTDSGSTWSHVGKGLASKDLAIGPIMIDPANPAVIYAGEYFGGARIFKSPDRGGAWSTINVSIGGASTIRLLGVAPASSAIYIGSELGVHKSGDGGATWSQTGLRSRSVTSLNIDRDNPATLYAAADRGIYKTTDGGATWGEANIGLPAQRTAISFIVDPSASRTLYAAVADGMAPVASLYKSTDGAATWRLLTTYFDRNLIRSLVVDPLTPSTLYVGTARGIFKTVNGGQNWQATGLEKFEIGEIVIDPTNPSVLYASTLVGPPPVMPVLAEPSGGVYKSSDGGTTWVASESLVKRTPIYSLAIDRQNPATLYAGAKGTADAFVLKIDPTGTKLAYAATVGGGNDDSGNSIAIDAAGNAYIAGATNSDPAPLFKNGFHSITGFGFMAKLNAAGTQFIYATLLPGQGNGIALDSLGKAYVTGTANAAAPLTVKNGFQTTLAGDAYSDAYLVRIDPDVTGDDSLLYSTYLGGGKFEEGRDLAVGSRGDAYVTGNTASIDFPTTPAARISSRGDIFVAKIDVSKSGPSSLVWSSAFGKGNVRGIAFSPIGWVYLTGVTAATDFPITPGTLQASPAGGSCGLIYNPPHCIPTCSGLPGCCISVTSIPCTDAFVTKLNADGTAVIYSTYLGSIGSAEQGKAIALDSLGNSGGHVYVAGSGKLPPTNGAFQNPVGDGFLARLDSLLRLVNLSTVSAASFLFGPVAPESLAASFMDAYGQGDDKLQAVVRDSQGVERQANALFSGSGQINYQIPAGTAPGQATVTATFAGTVISTGRVEIARVAPGVFAANANGRGVAAAVALRVKPDNSQAYETIARYDPSLRQFVSIPIDLGPEGEQIILSLFGTGWRFRSSESAVKVAIGGVDAPVTYAGLQPTLTGLDQINVRLPRTLIGRGEVDVVVTVDGKTTNATRIHIK